MQMKKQYNVLVLLCMTCVVAVRLLTVVAAAAAETANATVTAPSSSSLGSDEAVAASVMSSSSGSNSTQPSVDAVAASSSPSSPSSSTGSAGATVDLSASLADPLYDGVESNAYCTAQVTMFGIVVALPWPVSRRNSSIDCSHLRPGVVPYLTTKVTLTVQWVGAGVVVPWENMAWLYDVYLNEQPLTVRSSAGSMYVHNAPTYAREGLNVLRFKTRHVKWNILQLYDRDPVELMRNQSLSRYVARTCDSPGGPRDQFEQQMCTPCHSQFVVHCVVPTAAAAAQSNSSSSTTDSSSSSSSSSSGGDDGSTGPTSGDNSSSDSIWPSSDSSPFNAAAASLLLHGASHTAAMLVLCLALIVAVQ